MLSDDRKRANRRLGWILATVALAFAIGFALKITLLGR